MLQIIYAPNKIFRTKAEEVTQVNDEIRSIADGMLKTMQVEQAVGLGANMVGVLKRIAVVDLHENGVSNPLVFINPKIIWHSDKMQEFEEASLCFPGISAKISRPDSIKVSYIDYDGKEQEMEATGFLATVIQHEVDYLDGKIFLDYLSKMKRDVLLKKMEKYIKMNPPHVHGEHCHH